MRKVLILLVLMIVGIAAFASTKSTAVFDPNGKMLIDVEYCSEFDSVYFYDIDGNYITVDLICNFMTIYVNDEIEQGVSIKSNERIQHYKYPEISMVNLTDDEGTVKGYGLVILDKHGYKYVVTFEDVEIYE